MIAEPMEKKEPILPKKAKGSYVVIEHLTDAQRAAKGLSCDDTIVEIIGWGRDGVKDGIDEVRKATAYCRTRKITSFDTETTGLDPHSDRIILMQIGDDARQYLIWWQTLGAAAQEELVGLWGDKETKKLGVNLKFDAKMMYGNNGLHARGENLFDCQLIEQILCCGLTGDIGFTLKLTGMGEMAKRWKGWLLPKDEETRTGWGDMIPGEWWKPGATAEEIAKGKKKRYYAADDVVVPFALAKCQTPWIRRFEMKETVKLEMDFLPELAEMEIRGLRLDWDLWKALCEEAETEYKKAQRDLDRLFEVTVTHRVDLAGNVEITRDKDYTSKEDLKDFIREWMLKHKGVTIVGNNRQFRETLAAVGVPAARLDKLFQKKLVPDPNEVGKNKQVCYPGMADLIDGSEFTESIWPMYEQKLPEKCFALTTTDSKVLKLMRILHETPDEKIDPEMPTKIGLPPELVDPILNFRKYGTRLQRYAYAWKELIHPVTGNIHTDTTQCAADTARLTTSPNFQNLPRDQRYRTAVCMALPGRVIVGGDLSQIEPRIIAQISEDPNYMRVFWSGSPGTAGFDYWCGSSITEELDLYADTGATIGVLPSDVRTKKACKATYELSEGRSQSKVVVLGLGYGTGKPKFHVSLCLDTNMYHSREFADSLHDGYWGNYELVKEALDKLSAIADPKKSKRKMWHFFNEKMVTWSESLGGRKRFFDPNSPAWWTQGRNHPIQATGADILKRIVVELNKWAREKGVDGHVILTAHDELICDCATDVAERYKKAMERVMSYVGNIYCPNVPITADGYIGPHWIKD